MPKVIGAVADVVVVGIHAAATAMTCPQSAVATARAIQEDHYQTDYEYLSAFLMIFWCSQGQVKPME